ncbi:unnamed protein product [Bemisia tabaci]|uniref:Uncharacterized protein n=1 Tax=Bemisia tabaci TaxID=7038 RepID=A0A9P0AFW9_BEMTA|nr:unnamed protein product [Bemisia tabaci]
MARPSGKSFHLRWNNHLSNLQTLFESLYNEQHLVDVTISCADGFLKAHKLVLSACSPYFETIFKETPCKHPVIILKGILRQEMQAILEYMYAGAIDVHEDDLPCLLQVANDLQVKGLVQKGAEPGKASPRKEVEIEPAPKSIPQDDSASESESPDSMVKCEPMDLHENDENIEQNNETRNGNGNCLSHSNDSNDSSSKDEVQASNIINGFMEHLSEKRIVPEGLEISKVKLDDVGTDLSNIPEHVQKDFLTLYDFKNMYENGSPANQLMNRSMIPDKDLFCTICRRYFMNKQNMKRHLLTHSGEKQHQCTYCSAKFLRLSHLQRHQRTHTGEKPYACNQCAKTFSRSDKLKYHVEQQHSYGAKPYPPKQRGRPRKDPNLGSLHGTLSLQNLYNLGASFLQTGGGGIAPQAPQQLSNDQQYDVTISALGASSQPSPPNGIIEAD